MGILKPYLRRYIARIAFCLAQEALGFFHTLLGHTEGGATVIVRPSGTEPKIKTYFTTLGKDLSEAQAQKDQLAEALKPLLA